VNVHAYAAEAPALRIAGVSKRFGTLIANADIDLELAPGEIVALLGENGAGKTTLLNILSGQYRPDSGQIEVFGRSLPPGSARASLEAGIGIVHQHYVLADELSVLENIMIGSEPLWRWRQNRSQARARLAGIMADLGVSIDPDARVADLSVGERQRVEIVKALYRDVRILVLDEPTASLTPVEVESLFGALRNLIKRGKSIIFVSHKLREVKAISNRVIVLRRGQVVANWQTKRVSDEELAVAMIGSALPTLKRPPIVAGEEVLSLENVTVRHGSGAPALDRASLKVRAHEIVGIAGVAGNGQAVLADLICGLAAPASGTVRILNRVVGRVGPAEMIGLGVGRIPEDRLEIGLIGDMTVQENSISETRRLSPFSRFGILNGGVINKYARDLVAAYDVRCPDIDIPVRLLSGGNMQKLLLGRVLSRAPRLIIANQPTRGLDIGSTSHVHDQLLDARARTAGILLISDDLDELLALCDIIHVLYRGGLSEPIVASEADSQRLGLMMSGAHGSL
jgi:general nucleoside transport system ATP-binding protein